MTNNIIYNFGILMLVGGVVISLISIISLHFYKKSLDRKLDSEYGKRRKSR